jgi:multiple sugar transport system ATP-binding protein
MASVSLRDVTKRFGATEVVHGVSVEIADGELVVLVGPSGCGKSTLLRMIAGLEDVTAGEIHIGGRVMNGVAPKDRDVAMVFQNYALYPHMTVAGNMGFSLELRGERPDAIDRKVRAAAESLGLTPYLDRLPKQLSGGQRQRVAMGRSIVRDPRVFLFDEPLSNLDARLRVQMRTEIKALHQRLKTTTIHVTHDQIEAMTLADRIVVLHDGRVSQIGAPLDLYDRPDNLFVATFIGSPAMNVLDGEVVSSDGTGVFRLGADVVLPLPLSSNVSPGTRARYGVRPEHLSLGTTGVPAEIRVIEPTGSETHVAMTIAGQPLLGVFRDRVAAQPGDTVRIAIDPSRAHLFSPETKFRM